MAGHPRAHSFVSTHRKEDRVLLLASRCVFVRSRSLFFFTFFTVETRISMYHVNPKCVKKTPTVFFLIFTTETFTPLCPPPPRLSPPPTKKRAQRGPKYKSRRMKIYNFTKRIFFRGQKRKKTKKNNYHLRTRNTRARALFVHESRTERSSTLRTRRSFINSFHTHTKDVFLYHFYRRENRPKIHRPKAIG